jgi:hypothetical protein
LILALGSAGARGADLHGDEETGKALQPEFSPYLHQGHPNRVFWGDTHLHTSYSTDSGMLGNRLGPDEALRFAKGEIVVSSTGTRARLIRPFDFLVVSDHAENLGLAPMIAESNPDLLKDPWGKQVHDMVKAGKFWDAFLKWSNDGVATGKDPIANSAYMRTAWERIIAAVDRHNQPGVFTAFHAFEWTSTYQAKNLHRNVIFRDGKDKAIQVLPLSAYDTLDPERLWDYLENYEKKTGGRVLAIPHNGGLSNGKMFDVETLSGRPLDAAYAARRMSWEPLYEVIQPKGASEAHPLLSPNDEFADYYIWDRGDFGLNAKTPDMLPGEYARAAYKRGLEQQAKLGVNPFKFGLVGGTDIHNSLSSTREENYIGHFAGVEPGAGQKRMEGMLIGDRRPNNDGSLNMPHWRAPAAGLTGIWARENTREALWDAMERKETYATSGNRSIVRVFAGWDFKPEEVHRPDFAPQGYQRGVPMGGDLPRPSTLVPRHSPKFMVRALRDPDGANLDRIQIIKGWLGKDGKAQERVYDITVSDGRKIGPDGRCKTPVGNTVDLENATYANTIGEAFMAAWWEDPDFDPGQSAFYYVRVMEIPTPSWLVYDRKRLGIKIPEGAVLKQQERAYTSPIWYTPAN